MLEPLLSVKEVCAYLGVSRRTFQTWRSGNKLPCPDLRVGRTIRYKVSTLRAWVDRRP